MVFGTILIVLLVVSLVKGFILIHYAMLIVTCVHYLHCSSFPSKFILLKPVVIIAILKLPPISLVAETISRPRPITVVFLWMPVMPSVHGLKIKLVHYFLKLLDAIVFVEEVLAQLFLGNNKLIVHSLLFLQPAGFLGSGIAQLEHSLKGKYCIWFNRIPI